MFFKKKNLLCGNCYALLQSIECLHPGCLDKATPSHEACWAPVPCLVQGKYDPTACTVCGPWCRDFVEAPVEDRLNSPSWHLLLAQFEFLKRAGKSASTSLDIGWFDDQLRDVYASATGFTSLSLSHRGNPLSCAS